MKYDKRVGVILFAVLIAIALINEFYITQPVISDSDFTTYIIVPMLMLPLFALFMLKENLIPRVRGNDIIIGTCIFALLLVLILFLRIYLSYLFVDMRVDMLLFPLMIAALAALLFGAGNITRFRAIMLYSIFASPALLLWLGSANNSFILANTLVVYSALKLIFIHAAYIAPMTIKANNYSIGIGQTCIGIGVLIGTIMFLAPLAYLYDGKPLRKLAWVASGFGLMLILNVTRMLGISMAWFTYGPSNTILTVHSFAGILLFYISIIAMVMLAGRYGLTFPHAKKRTARPRGSRPPYFSIAVAVLITLVYVFMLSDYYSASIIPPLALYGHVPFNVAQAEGLVNAMTSQNSFSIEVIQNYVSNTIEARATNATYNASAPIAILISDSGVNYLPELLRNNTVAGRETFFSNSSLVENIYYVISHGNGFVLYTETMPYYYPNGTSTSENIYAIVPAKVTSPDIMCINYYNTFYTYAASLFDSDSYRAKMSSAYCTVQKLVNP